MALFRIKRETLTHSRCVTLPCCCHSSHRVDFCGGGGGGDLKIRQNHADAPNLIWCMHAELSHKRCGSHFNQGWGLMLLITTIITESGWSSSMCFARCRNTLSLLFSRSCWHTGLRNLVLAQVYLWYKQTTTTSTSGSSTSTAVVVSALWDQHDELLVVHSFSCHQQAGSKNRACV